VSGRVESTQTQSQRSIILRAVSDAALSIVSVVMADVDLSHGLDRAPDPDEAGFHHKAVAGAVPPDLATFFLDFDEAREDVAELEGGALDGMGLARRSFLDAGQHLLAFRGVQRPRLEGWVA
jgi:hypothetical protein